jgi:DNA-binding GntR family transcriptional regulator
MTELIMEGETPILIYGLYLVDSYLGWLDEEDFTDEELAQIEKEYGGNNRYSLEKFVRSLPEREQEQYLYIPHYFLILDGLILDAASDMFQTENSPDRYFTDKMVPVLDSI